MIELTFDSRIVVRISLKPYLQPFISDRTAGSDFTQVEICVATERGSWSGENLVFPTSDLRKYLDELIVEFETGFEESGGVFKYFEHAQIGIGFDRENELQTSVRFEFKAKNVPDWLGPSGDFSVNGIFTNEELFKEFAVLRGDI